MLIVGSTALVYHGLQHPVPADIDVIGTQAELDALQADGFTPVSGRAFRVPACQLPIDFEVATPGSSAEAYLRIEGEDRDRRGRPYEATIGGKPAIIASIDLLYSLKRSHRHRPKAWYKHIRDYHMLKHIVRNVDIFVDITAQREAEYLIKTPSLNKSVADFFDDNVSNRVFNHDQLHEVMAYYQRPMFEQIRISADKVTCSKAKWDALDTGDKMCCVKEEAYVIALERAVIPMMFSGGPRVKPDLALNWAIMRICTTLCAGWFRDFATEHFPSIEAGLNLDYYKQFFEAVDSGRITRID